MTFKLNTTDAVVFLKTAWLELFPGQRLEVRRYNSAGHTAWREKKMRGNKAASQSFSAILAAHDKHFKGQGFDDDPSPDAVTGEVVVSGETAHREADERGKSARHELLLYVAHGVLHLLGWDDDTPARRDRMNARAAEILVAAGVGERGP